MTLMEGTLWKWTNYLSGWQPRFFVLEVGVLAYYKSQEEVGRGSKGSIKMGCCEISVHPTDNVRIDLKIPPDQYIYLRAATSAERQQWLVALGTSKACLARPQPSDQKGDSDVSQMNQLKDSMQELGMYRSLLLQQVNTIKLLCIEKNQSQEFSEAATMLSATCDEFLKNLCDCMELADANFGGTPDKSKSKHSNFRKHLLHESHRTTSPPLSPTSPTSSISSSSFGSTMSEQPSLSATSEHSTESDKSLLPRQPRAEPIQPQQSAHGTAHKVHNHPDSSRNGSPAPDSTQKRSQPESATFFSTAPHRFEDVSLTPDKGIPTKSFLAACSSILPFFDILGSTAFAPVKMDIGGNIKKLSIKFDMDPKAFHTLQNMIYQEIKSNTCTVKNAATDALLWLKRALEFMQIFLLEVLNGTQDLAVAASVAYENTLKKYHGWIVRGVFAMAVKAVPYREDFLTALGTIDHHCAPPAVVLRHIKVTVTALGNLIDILNKFYQTNKLDADYTV